MGRGVGRRPRGRLSQLAVGPGQREPRSLLDRLASRRRTAGLRDTLSDAAKRAVTSGASVGVMAAAFGAGAIASLVLVPRTIKQVPRPGAARGAGRTLSVADVMTRDVVTAAPETTTRELARLMESRNVGTVIITKDSQLRGLVTDRQIVTRCIARGKNPDECRADDVMTEEVPGPAGIVTAHPRMDLLEAARLMGEHRVRRLPVVENGAVVGILSVADMADEVKEMVSAVMDELSKAAK